MKVFSRYLDAIVTVLYVPAYITILFFDKIRALIK